MNLGFVTLYFVFLLSAGSTVWLILMQEPKGGGISDLFGSGGGSAADLFGGGRQGGARIKRLTWISSGVFTGSIVLMSLLGRGI